MRVEVTQADINNSNSDCPIERSLIRTIGYGSVSRSYAYITIEGKVKKFDLPTEAREFVIAYDAELPVEPITFDMEESQ